ncbi:type VI secretion system baseplate subunit TssF [Halarcobacter ebronensis]|uniref:Type VI secretion system baseplate subunit TssF n=1 Tax=Halarcobacter ebronensis TaxID=1462615 RepID=A0A4Q1AI74_9BACT|nr:type VI secretion system baseplate subunit TssF [Halarcobacter ebronensis]QKF81485.1 type VI secretion system, baseplate protein [Halarcobacter ebronensis]RXK02455.1 type VI secretion system baseplate subunit TssF [Halarcobacter ebronensis]
MVFNDYYKKELIALRDDGANFSKKNPGLSTFLSKEGQDPDVERLLEGFAFLTGRLKQQLDKELPEVAHTLVELLWSNYTKPIPSFSIIQFEPIKESTTNTKVNKGTEVLSKVKPDAIQCKFRTTYDTVVMPFHLKNVDYHIYGKRSILELNMNLTTSGSLLDIVFNDLRIYLSGSKFIAQDLYLFLTRYIESIEIQIKDSDKNLLETLPLNKESIFPVGFSSSYEPLTPQSANVFDGYLLLQDFFCFKDRFLFVDIKNLNLISSLSSEILSQSREFTIKINFSKKMAQSNLPKKENFSLYCTPIVNIFETDSVPIRKNSDFTEFLVLPADLDKNYSEVYSILQVRGWIPKKHTYKNYLPFESFEHLDDDNGYYSTRIKLTNDGERTNTYIRFSNLFENEEDINKTNSTVSVKILCTNKDVPSSLLLGDISILNAMSNSANVSFKNITIPTISYPPPLDGDFLWRVISNMSLNYLSLSDVKTLRAILETYDFFGAHDIKQREKTLMMLKGLESIEYETCEMIDKGLPIRGMHIKLKIDPHKFSCIGEAYLFSSVLNEFFSLYSNINSFHRLSVDILNEELFVWRPRLGSQELI